MQEAERRWLAPAGRHEPLLERDQAQVPQHPVRGHWQEMNGFSNGEASFDDKTQRRSTSRLCEGTDDVLLVSGGGLLSHNTPLFDCFIF